MFFKMQEMILGNENNIVSHNSVIEARRQYRGHTQQHSFLSAAAFQQAVIPQPSRKNNQCTVYYKCR